MAKRRKARRPSLGDEVTGKMTDEQLEVHRDLQLLRAAGVASSHRRPKRRAKPVNADSRQLSRWVSARGKKLDDLGGEA